MFKARASLVFFFIVSIKKSEECDNGNNCSTPYEPPSNIKYPYGDENQLNVDVCANDTHSFLFKDQPAFVPEGRCPFPPEDPGDLPLTNPYVECPVFPELVSPGNVPLGDPVVPPPPVQCRYCDLKLTDDNEAVLLKCNGCFDLPNPAHESNTTEKDLLYKVFFIEIANYTSVEVQGREHFNI